MIEKWIQGDGVTQGVYVDRKDGEDEFICDANTPALAAQIVREHNEFPRWVKCAADHMPKDPCPVLTWDGANQNTAYWHDNVWKSGEDEDEPYDQPTHWMPLPTPPKD